MRKVRETGRRRTGRVTAAVAALALVVWAGAGCSKKSRPVPLPPPVTSSAEAEAAAAPREVDPSAPVPELEIFLEPAVVSPGETAVLRWETRNADRVVIAPDIGPVIVSGRLKLYPETSATYQVTAEGPGGTVSKSATLDVVAGGAPGFWDEVDSSPLAERFRTAVKPVYFDFDSAELTAEARITLDGNVRWLTRPDNRAVRLLIEGHCDKRGTEQYNLALGDKRSQVVRAYLIEHGVDPSRVASVSLGEERPFAPGDSEEDHALNRRAHFVLLGESP